MPKSNTPGYFAEIEIVKAAIGHPAGWDLDFAGGLIMIRSTDQGTIEVEWREFADDADSTGTMRWESFDADTQLTEAATLFVDRRYEFQYGIDFEQELLAEQHAADPGTTEAT